MQIETYCNTHTFTYLPQRSLPKGMMTMLRLIVLCSCVVGVHAPAPHDDLKKHLTRNAAMRQTWLPLRLKDFLFVFVAFYLLFDVFVPHMASLRLSDSKPFRRRMFQKIREVGGIPVAALETFWKSFIVGVRNRRVMEDVRGKIMELKVSLGQGMHISRYIPI